MISGVKNVTNYTVTSLLETRLTIDGHWHRLMTVSLGKPATGDIIVANFGIALENDLVGAPYNVQPNSANVTVLTVLLVTPLPGTYDATKAISPTVTDHMDGRAILHAACSGFGALDVAANVAVSAEVWALANCNAAPFGAELKVDAGRLQAVLFH
jgi:hypothetical protein